MAKKPLEPFHQAPHRLGALLTALALVVPWVLCGCPGDSWRRIRPSVTTQVTVRTPAYRQAVLQNGLTVMVYESRQLPLVAVHLALRAGIADVPAGKAGLMQLSYDLLRDGTVLHDAVGLAEAFDAIGSSPEVRLHTDGGALEVQVLTPYAERALSLLAELVRYPRFSPEDLDERRTRLLEEQISRAGSPLYLSGRALHQAIYGQGHPYGAQALITPKTLSSIRRDDVLRFYERNVGPRNVALILSGMVTFEQAIAWAQRHFGDWHAPVHPPLTPSPPVPKPRRDVVVVPKPGLVQTRILLGRAAVPFGHPKEAALRVANVLYGDRLGGSLREEQGYTYGTTLGLSLYRGGGYLSAGSAVRADATGTALSEALELLRRLRQEALSNAEVYRARASAIWEVVSLFKGIDGLGQAAANLYYLGQPADGYHRLVTRLRSVEHADVEDALADYFNPDLMQIVLVGDPTLIYKEVTPLGLGTITYFSLDGGGSAELGGGSTGLTWSGLQPSTSL